MHKRTRRLITDFFCSWVKAIGVGEFSLRIDEKAYIFTMQWKASPGQAIDQAVSIVELERMVDPKSIVERLACDALSLQQEKSQQERAA